MIETFGPSTIQPVVAARRLPRDVKAEVRAVLLQIVHDPAAREALAAGCVERFVSVTDADYDDIRTMRDVARAAGFLTLR